ncbi:MAG: hypothetical protein AMJ64_08400 [Betaproteobacteria bacterium SG8_39]|nr:MAG: hypothetical protein AMJ64_08400 [Betaproteobacteria bacterium SG8_39]
MSAILNSIGRTLLAGGLLLAAIIVMTGALSGQWIRLDDFGWWLFAMRWLHVLAATLWVGLLYYFNFVQMPALPRIPDAQRPAISQFIAPAALFWFRWAAVATVVSGLLLAQMQGYLGAALSLSRGVQAIGIGMWLGLVMAANVWFVIWPKQKKVLGLVPAEAPARAAAAAGAAQASRLNLLLSVPMLYCMVAQQNGGL